MNERQVQIIEAAIQLFLEQGVGVSTASIAKAAGVSNGTLFNAFATKQALIDAVYLTTKTSLAAALSTDQLDRFDRQSLHRVWSDYIAWGRQHPSVRKVMPLLKESGLASEEAKAKAEDKFSAHNIWLSNAYQRGDIRGPSIDYLGHLIFFHMDLVLDLKLEGEDEAISFDMLSQSIGLLT